MAKSVDTLPVKATLLVVSTLTVMAGATIAPSLPAMAQHFAEIANAGYWVRLVLTVPALAIALCAPFVGILIDRLGRKPLLVTALLLYGLAGSSELWFSSLGWILAGRALLGLSVAGIMTTATTLITDYYAGPTRGQVLGWQSSCMALGGVVFLTVGGFLADLQWRLPFAIYLTALVLAPCALLILPEPNREGDRTSASGGAGAEPVTLPAQWVALTYGIALLAQIVFYTIPVQLPFHLKDLVDASASQSGLAIALSTLFMATGSFLYQRVKSRLNFLSVYTLAFLAIAMGYGLIGLAQGYGVLLPGLAMAGAGLGLLMPNMSFCLTSIAPSLVRGRVLSGLTTCIFLGQFLSPLVSQPLSQWVGLGATYSPAAATMAIAAVIAGVSLMWQRRSRSSR